MSAASASLFLVPAAVAASQGRLSLACTAAAQSLCGGAVSLGMRSPLWLRADRALLAWHAGLFAGAPMAGGAQVAAAGACKAASWLRGGDRALDDAWRLLLLVAALMWLEGTKD